jgi:N-acetylglucosamine kinase
MILAFDIGGTRIKVARQGPIGLQRLGDTPTPADSFPAFVNALQSFLHGDETGACFSIAGVVDPQTGAINVANIPCLQGRPIVADLQRALGLPVLILNDADSFSLAEATHGAGRGHSSVFGLILGTGVGGGLIIDGRLVTGAGGFAGEWGHGPVIRDPALRCGCGQTGCLDTIGGGAGLSRLHKHLTGNDLDALQILSAWRSGQDQTTITHWLDLVSGALSLVVNVVGASVMPVGGGLSQAVDLITALDLNLRRRILWKTSQRLIVSAECGPEAGLIGAAEAGFAKFFGGKNAA